jgi:hypothetical protein
MKFLIVLALFVAIACALPVEEVGQNLEIDEVPPTLEAENLDVDYSDGARAKRHHYYG